MPGQRIPIVTRTPVHAGLDHPTCTWPATLPTDPEALRTLLYAQPEPWGTLSQDETVFRNVGDLLGSTIMPPATASALYKVLERIPGVTVIPDTVDAAGRHGIGITRTDPASATRDEWIFKKNTLAYSRLTVIHDRRQAHGRHRRHVVRHRRHHGARGRRQVRRGPRERRGLTLARTPPGRPTPGCPRRRRPHPVRTGRAIEEPGTFLWRWTRRIGMPVPLMRLLDGEAHSRFFGVRQSADVENVPPAPSRGHQRPPTAA